MRAALYARVSTADQHTENQLSDLRAYAQTRGWLTQEFVDSGISGTREKRPALDDLVRLAHRRQIDVVICWRLDRLGRNLKHLVTLIDTWQQQGVSFISLGEGIDAMTPAGKLQLHILAALAEFERARIVERVKAGLARTKAKGTPLGRRALVIPLDAVRAHRHLPVRQMARALKVSVSTAQRWKRQVA